MFFPKNLEYVRKNQNSYFRRACDGNWREEKRKSGEGDVPDLHRGDKFNIRKQDKENRDQQWTDRKPITLNEKFTRNDRKPKFNDEKFSGSRGFKKTTEKKVFKPSREFDERKKLDDTREVKGKLTQNANYGVDLVGKRFEKGSKTWKDSSENGDLEIKKKVSDRGDKSEKKHKRFEESRKLRHAMKKGI